MKILFTLVALSLAGCAARPEHRISLMWLPYPDSAAEKAEEAAMADRENHLGRPSVRLSPVGEEGTLVPVDWIVAKMPPKYQAQWRDPRLPAEKLTIPRDVWEACQNAVAIERKHDIWPDAQD